MSLNLMGSSYLRFLTDEQVRVLHESTLKVLERTGVLIDHDRLQTIFEERGATIDRERNIVRIPPDLVEESIAKAPKRIILYGRREENNLVFEGRSVYTHTTGGPPFFYDFETGERRPALKKDVAVTAKLVDALDNIHAYMPLVSPTDVDARAVEVEMVDAAVRNTTKVIGNPVMSKDEVQFMYEIFTVIAGGEKELRERPMFEISASPVSPLVYDANISNALVLAAELGIPTTILPCPMTGGTAPVTFAGALVQQNAELLAGLTIMQLINPGTAVILGPRLSVMDMRTGYNAWGTPEIGMASVCAVQLAQYYDLPVDVYGLCSDSRLMDQQSGYERAMNGLMPALAGADWISGAGGMEAGKSASLEQLVIDNEIFGMIFKVVKGFEINEETLALDIIHKVGPKGNFLKEMHTVKYTRQGEQYFPKISNRLEWEQWVEQGSKDIITAAKIKAEEILEKHEVTPLDDYKIKELDNILMHAREYYAKK